MRSESFHNYIIDNDGGDDVPNGIRQVDHNLKQYLGILLMISTNKEIKKGRSNDALCRGISIILEKNEQFICAGPPKQARLIV